MTVLRGDSLSMLQTLPDNSVQCVVTSPPYWALRRYDIPDIVFDGDPGCAHEWTGVTRIGGGKQTSEKVRWQHGPEDRPHGHESITTNTCALCGAWRGQLGQEPTPDMFIRHMVDIFREVRRVLRLDGTCWLNMGDCYSANFSGNNGYQDGRANRDKRMGPGLVAGLKAKDLVGIPWMLAFALRADGWYLRAENIWAKGISFCPTYAGSVMPESVTDRPTRSHEQVFLLTKSERYFYDHEAVKEQGVYPAGTRAAKGSGTREGNRRGGTRKSDLIGVNGRNVQAENSEAKRRDRVSSFANNPRDRISGYDDDGYAIYDGKRNLRTVWAIGVDPFDEAHFATYPPDLVVPCLKAGTSQKGACSACGAPWKRVVDYEPTPEEIRQQFEAARARTGDDHGRDDGFTTRRPNYQRKRIGERWEPTCGCDVNGAFSADDFDIIESPTGEVEADDPSLVTGRRGFNRPRGENEGRRPITRYEQRRYAEQIRQSPHGAEMATAAGPAFDHYIRTDRSGARPVPADMLDAWIECGWLTRVEPPERKPFDVVPCVVLDPFAGSGTTGVVCELMRLRFIGIDLGYHEMSDRRIAAVAPLFAPPPPGERAEDELTAAEASAALRAHLR